MDRTDTAQDNEVQPKQSLEIRIGLYWLHKLGIASLVFGVAFLLMYSYQLLGPAFKLLTAMAVAGILVFFGERMALHEKKRWFGHGLIGGGWSLAYFTTYAAHYLPSVQVISSLPIEVFLLLSVAAGSLFSALRARSEAMSIYSITLASAAIMLSGPSLFSDVSFVILAIACSILGNTKDWKRLFAFGLLACYAGHFYCAWTIGSVSANWHNDLIATIFLALIWLVFSAGIGYSIRVGDGAKTFGTAIAYVNAAALSIGLIVLNGRHVPDLAQILLSSAGGVYLAIGRWLRKREQDQHSILHSMLGLTLINGAKLLHFSGLTLIVLDIMQIALLGVIGARYNIRSFRWFAAFLSCALFPVWIFGAISDLHDEVLGISAFEYFKVGVMAIAVLAGLAWLYSKQGANVNTPKVSDKASVDFYYLAVNAMVSLTFLMIVDSSWRAFALTLQAIANHVIAARIKDDFYALIGTVYCCVCGALLMIGVSSWTTAPILMAIAVSYGAYSYTRSLPQDGSSRLAIMPVYAYLGTVLLTVLLFEKLPKDFVTMGIGVEGIGLLLTGFLLNIALFRISGLIVLSILAGKLLFFDMTKFDTLERIISFIAAGGIFLLSSSAYAKFTHAFEDKGSTKETKEVSSQ
jgi:uncharacterized membrane protein